MHPDISYFPSSEFYNGTLLDGEVRPGWFWIRVCRAGLVWFGLIECLGTLFCGAEHTANMF